MASSAAAAARVVPATARVASSARRRRRSRVVASSTSSSRSSIAARVRPRPRSRAFAPRASADDDDDTVSVSDLVEMEVAGVSVSDAGFALVLTQAGWKDHLPRARDEIESMRIDAPADPASRLPADVASRPVLALLLTTSDDDVDGARSEHAQTTLQLLQTPPIDMGIQLPYDALDDVTGMSGAVLGAVLVGKATFADGSDDDDDGSFVFESTLLAGKEFEQNSYDVVGGAAEAWKATALALRYAPYGARIFATRGALEDVNVKPFRAGEGKRKGKRRGDGGYGGDGGGLTLGTVRDVFPLLQTVNEARAIDAAARRLVLDPFMSASFDDDEVTSDDVGETTAEEDGV
jgi:hypothetical protein